MKPTKKMQHLLERMAAIERMERGTLCQMGERPHYNHQTWRDGKNVVRYVPKDDMAQLKKDLAGYQRFLQLTEHYADEVIRATHREREKEKRSKKTKS